MLNEDTYGAYSPIPAVLFIVASPRLPESATEGTYILGIDSTLISVVRWAELPWLSLGWKYAEKMCPDPYDSGLVFEVWKEV